jgi:hypothetical protein
VNLSLAMQMPDVFFFGAFLGVFMTALDVENASGAFHGALVDSGTAEDSKSTVFGPESAPDSKPCTSSKRTSCFA